MFLLFFLAWIVFNGKITVEIVLFGLAIAAAVFLFICKFMDYSLQKEKSFYMKFPFFCKYVFTLVKEIGKANMAVIHMILTRTEIMEPVIVKFKTKLRTEEAKVMLANSITLTPGTITVSMEEDELVVHCLDNSLAEGMEDSIFVEMLETLEEKEN